jgi:hypothetical protein
MRSQMPVTVRHELIEAFVARVPTVRNNVLTEVAMKIVEAAEENSKLAVKSILEIVHNMKTLIGQ